jgi:hypothetical protein
MHLRKFDCGGRRCPGGASLMPQFWPDRLSRSKRGSAVFASGLTGRWPGDRSRIHRGTV